MARRGRTGSTPLEVRISCEPRWVSPAGVALAYERVGPLPRRLAPQAGAPPPAESAPPTPQVGRRQLSCILYRQYWTRGCRRSRKRRRTPWRARSQPCGSAWRSMGEACPRRGRCLTQDIVGPRWYAQRWSACGMSSRRAVSTGSLGTRPSAWPAHRRLKSCWSLRADVRASRCSSSTGPWGRAQKTPCGCRGQG